MIHLQMFRTFGTLALQIIQRLTEGFYKPGLNFMNYAKYSEFSELFSILLISKRAQNGAACFFQFNSIFYSSSVSTLIIITSLFVD
jgi:hypothetical protein